MAIETTTALSDPQLAVAVLEALAALTPPGCPLARLPLDTPRAARYVRAMDAETTTSAHDGRIVGRPWPKGRSGNPGGLPAGVAGKIMRARRLALKYAPKAIETLAAMLDAEDPRVRVAAAEGLLDRAGLKPFALEPERLEVTAAVVDVDSLRAELARRAAALVIPVESRTLSEAASALTNNDGQLQPKEPPR
jgi:hypothetical protein